jgi:hypothetical protein
VADTGEIFLNASGGPVLRRCAVLYLDLLGVRAMARSPKAQDHLTAIARAVTSSYRNFLDPASQWPAAMLSDALILAAPIPSELEERATIFGLINQAALLQLSLVEQGLFVRGAIVVGDFHIHDGLIFGQALGDAYERETKDAVHPRVILDGPAAGSQAASGTEDDEDAAATLLMRDEDGWTFIDYLATLFDEYEDPRPRLAAHRDTIEARLEVHRSDRRLWEKYRWVAEYHNEVINTRIPAETRLLVAQPAMTWRFRPFSP